MRRLFKNFLPVIFLVFFTGIFFSCDNLRNASDMRQIMAKNEIMDKLNKISSFDITGFSEDTIRGAADANFKKVIRYQLDITYLDSNKVPQNKKGIVLFTPDGKSIIHSQIND
jgi:CRISPR/Cas system CSM-associated protein Csm5 (group 7 of RAMP superfamily)